MGLCSPGYTGGKTAGATILGLMFFRRKHLKNPTFAERLETLRSAGFTLAPLAGGVVRASRGRCAVDLKDDNGTVAIVGRAGMVQGSEISTLLDGGFQKFFETPSGGKQPALADHLTALHEFEEDLKQGLGQESYYNQSLGTVSTSYWYDRVKDRDRGVPKRVWE